FLGKRELFFKECYLHRIAEVLDHAYLFLNNLELARYYAFIVINADICAKTVSDATYIVGMSYLLEDAGSCLEYLQKSYDIAKTIGDNNIEHEARQNLDFVKLYLNVKLPEDSDAALINFQNNKESEINLNSLKEVMYLKGEDDLIVLFGAISSGSIQRFHDCFLEYFQQTNYFFASIMAKELRDRGDSTVWAMQAMNFTIKTEEGNHFEKDFISGFSRFSNCSERGCA
ncbi:MAG: AimR family lysis-lysogeny pheromone receptor, partial [Bacillus sp. (in: firmicutes)]